MPGPRRMAPPGHREAVDSASVAGEAGTTRRRISARRAAAGALRTAGSTAAASALRGGSPWLVPTRDCSGRGLIEVKAHEASHHNYLVRAEEARSAGFFGVGRGPRRARDGPGQPASGVLAGACGTEASLHDLV